MNALWGDLVRLWQARGLLWVLVQRDVASRHAGSAGGVMWLYAQPLLTVAAYYLVFDVVFAMRLGENAPTRAAGAFLIVGSLPWMAFGDALGRGMNSLLDSGHLLQKNPIPPVLLPVRSVLSSLRIFGPLLLLMVLLYAPSHGFSLPVISVLPLLLAEGLLVLLLGYLLAIAAAALRDTVQVVSFILSIGIFMSPVLFPMDMFPKDWAWVLWANPMTPIVIGFQQVLLKGAWPPLPIWGALLAWIAVFAALLNLAIARSRDELVDWL